MQPLPADLRQPPPPPRPPAPPATGGDGSGFYSGGGRGPSGGGSGSSRPGGPAQFIHEVLVEMRKVGWPTRDEVLHNAAIYLTFLTLLATLLVGVDLALTHLVRTLVIGG